MTFKKTDLTIPNQLYGDRIVVAYAKEGVAVARVGKAWGVFHIRQGCEIFHRLQRRTKGEAVVVAEKVLALHIDWNKAPGDKQFDEDFRAAVEQIRGIAG